MAGSGGGAGSGLLRLGNRCVRACPTDLHCTTSYSCPATQRHAHKGQASNTHRHPPLQHHAQAPTRMLCVCYCQGPMMGPTLLPPGRGPPRSPLYRAQVRATATARPHHSPGKGEGEAQAGSPRRSRLWPPSLHHPASKLPGLHLGVCRLCATWLEGRNTSGCAISALCRHLAKPSGLLGAGFLAQLQRSSSTHKAPQG